MNVLTAVPSTRFHAAAADAEPAHAQDNTAESGAPPSRPELTGSTSAACLVPSSGLHPAIAEKAQATIFSMLDSMVKHPVSHEPEDGARATGKSNELPQELLEVIGGIAATVAGVAVAFSVGPVAASALPAVASSVGPVAGSTLLAAAFSVGPGADGTLLAPIPKLGFE